VSIYIILGDAWIWNSILVAFIINYKELRQGISIRIPITKLIRKWPKSTLLACP